MAKYQIIRSKKAIAFLLNQRNLRGLPRQFADKRVITSEDVKRINDMLREKRKESTT